MTPTASSTNMTTHPSTTQDMTHDPSAINVDAATTNRGHSADKTGDVNFCAQDARASESVQ